MFNIGSLPVIRLNDYTLTVIPKGNFLQLKGEYHLESNFTIPDNFMELIYKLPSQTIDKLFLKFSGKTCNPVVWTSICNVYKNTAFVDVLNDPVLSHSVKQNTLIPFSTSFLINEQVKRNIVSHDEEMHQALTQLNQQIQKLSVKNSLVMQNHYFIGEKEWGSNSRYTTLNLQGQLTLKKNGTQSYAYTKLGLYLSSWDELQAGSPLLYMWVPNSEKNVMTITEVKTLNNSIRWIEDKDSSTFIEEQVDGFWRESNSKEKLFEFFIPKKNSFVARKNLFKEGQMNLQLSITIGENIYSLNIKSLLINQKRTLKAKNHEILIDPNDSLLKSFPIDHTWIVEKI